MRLALCALVLVACDTGAPALPSLRSPREIESGGRLTARTWRVGAHQVFRDFVDRATGEPCTFTNNVGPGPSYRCLPSSAALHAEGQGPYVDSACTIPAGIVTKEPSAYVIVERVNACANERTIFRAGPAQNSKTYAKDGNECVSLSTTPIPVQRLEREISANAFVRALPSLEEGGSRIVRTSLVAEDGARQPFEGFDTERNEHVTVDLAAFGAEEGAPAPRWRPSRVAFINAGPPLFANDTCTVQVATKVGRDAACPPTAVLVFQGLCGQYQVHAIGDLIASPKAKVGTFCQDASSRSLAYALGAPIPRDAFPLLERVEVERLGVKRRGYVGPDANVVMWGDVLAPESGEPCIVARASDGVDRCLPAQTASAGVFADAACTIPAIRFAATGCAKDVLSKYLRIGEQAFLVGEQTKTVFVQDGGACRAATLAPVESAFIVTEVDVGLFPAATE